MPGLRARGRPAADARLSREQLVAPLAALGLALATTAAIIYFPTPDPVKVLVGLVAIPGVLWLMLSTRYELSLLVLLVYLGALDGLLKLSTGAELATLGRDVILYAIAVGWLVRALIGGEPIPRPPLTGLILAFVGLVAIQLANPQAAGLSESLAATRQHLEFVPLFFFGWALMRTPQRLRWFLGALAALAAVNGVVGLVQTLISVESLAAWGPGYRELIEGTGDVSARVYFQGRELVGVRPFALGSDTGFGGVIGMLAAPAVLALFALSRNPREFVLVSLGAGWIVVAIATSQARVAVVASVLSVLALFALLPLAKRSLAIPIAIGLMGLTLWGLVDAVGSQQFDRYQSIAPGEVVGTTFDYRKDTFERLPDYLEEFPLGLGLGTAGPAAGFLDRALDEAIDTESQVSFLLAEIGIAGVILFLAIHLRLLAVAATRIRRIPLSETRIMLAAVAAPLFGLFAFGFIGAFTTSSPAAPYFWFAAGVLAYWLMSPTRSAPPPARS